MSNGLKIRKVDPLTVKRALYNYMVADGAVSAVVFMVKQEPDGRFRVDMIKASRDYRTEKKVEPLAEALREAALKATGVGGETEGKEVEPCE